MKNFILVFLFSLSVLNSESLAPLKTKETNASSLVKKLDINKKNLLSWEKSCNNEDYFFCLNLEYIYSNGIQTKRNKQKANYFYKKIYNSDDVDSLMLLTSLYLIDDKKNIRMKKVQSLIKKSCSIGNMLSCTLLGESFVENNKYSKKSKHYFEKACDGGDATGCYHLGNILYQGELVKEDKKNAINLYEISCADNIAPACTNMAYLLIFGDGMKKNTNKAIQLLRNACSTKNPNACYLLGLLYYEGNGVKKNLHKSIAFLNKACISGHSDACKDMSFIKNEHQQTNKHLPVYNLYYNACKNGLSSACKKFDMLSDKN